MQIPKSLKPSTSKERKKRIRKTFLTESKSTNGKEEFFITLKDYKPHFENNTSARLINPAKNEI